MNFSHFCGCAHRRPSSASGIPTKIIANLQAIQSLIVTIQCPF
jgi:hypothetical protein